MGSALEVQPTCGIPTMAQSQVEGDEMPRHAYRDALNKIMAENLKWLSNVVDKIFDQRGAFARVFSDRGCFSESGVKR
jgi:hypothetical protein